MDKNRLPRQALHYRPNGQRNVERPRKRWVDQLHLEAYGPGNTSNPPVWTWWWWCKHLKCIKKTNTMHRFVPLLYFICWLLHVSAVVCHLQGASGSVWVTWKIQIDMVVNHVMLLGGVCVGVSRFSLLCFPAGKHNKLHLNTPTHRPPNHIIW
jgi:hypothetical protein